VIPRFDKAPDLIIMDTNKGLVSAFEVPPMKMAIVIVGDDT
jgi:hypothetical protein